MTMAPPGQMSELSTPVDVRFSTAQKQRRATVFFRLILIIPQLVVLWFVGIAAYVVVFLGWFAALFTGRMPESFAKFLLGFIRWSTRVLAYEYLLTDQYPPFSLDPDPTYPIDVTVTTGRLNRAAVFFRFILVIPAAILTGILAFGYGVIAIVTWVLTLVKGQMPDALFGASTAVIRYQARYIGFYFMLTSFYPGDVFGDKGPNGRPLEAPVSGTLLVQSPPPPPPPPPPAPPGGWAAGGAPGGTAPAWGAQPEATAPVPPPPAGGYIPPSTPTPPPPPTADESGLPIPPAFGEAPSQPSASPLPSFGTPPLPPPPPPQLGTMPPPPPPGFGATASPSAPPYGSVPPPAPPWFGAGPGLGGRVSRFWPLVLTKGARTMLVVFIVVGALGFVGYVVAFPALVSVKGIESSIATQEVESAYSSLGTAANTFKSSVEACSSSSPESAARLQCLEQADTTWSQALQAYGTTISEIAYPSSAQAAAAQARSAVDGAVTIVNNLAASPDLQSYAAAASSPAFQTALDNIDTTYDQLIQTLSTS